MVRFMESSSTDAASTTQHMLLLESRTWGKMKDHLTIKTKLRFRPVLSITVVVSACTSMIV